MQCVHALGQAGAHRGKVLQVMHFHGCCIDVRLQGIVVIGKGGQWEVLREDTGMHEERKHRDEICLAVITTFVPLLHVRLYL